MRELPIPVVRLLSFLCSFRQKRVKRIIDGERGKGGGGGGDVRSFGTLMERGERVVGKMCAPSASRGL